MPPQAFIELQAIKLDTKIGTYPLGAAHPTKTTSSKQLWVSGGTAMYGQRGAISRSAC